MGGDLERLPGFRRRFLVTPGKGQVRAAVEDDYHCMAVTLSHDGEVITRVAADMNRAPWTTCPGAQAVIVSTFTGVSLSEVARRGEKQMNCTHLYDLALLAANHALDDAEHCYELLASDPVDGVVTAEIRHDGWVVHRITHRDDILLEPPGLAGTSLFKLRGWIESLAGLEQEAARLLQWGTIMAHGRSTPMDRQSDASKMPANCYTFQEDRKYQAERVGKMFDFSQGPYAPLDHLDAGGFRMREHRAVEDRSV